MKVNKMENNDIQNQRFRRNREKQCKKVFEIMITHKSPILLKYINRFNENPAGF